MGGLAVTMDVNRRGPRGRTAPRVSTPPDDAPAMSTRPIHRRGPARARGGIFPFAGL